MSNLHNKSGKEYISVYYLSDEEISFHYDEIMNKYVNQKDVKGNCMKEGSKCWYVGNSQGRYIPAGHKNQLCYAYQVVARKKLGNKEIRANKQSASDLSISQLCGAKNSVCVNPDHIIIETKRINDERTHCHFSMDNIRQSLETSNRRQFDLEYQFRLSSFSEGYCPHNPKCGSIKP
jgi:hypothetical protein